MNAPNAEMHNPNPNYLRKLVSLTGLSQAVCAKRIGIGERTMREYLRVPNSDKPAPYCVQYALEMLAAIEVRRMQQ